MHHDDDVSARAYGLRITRLLIGAVAEVLRVEKRVDAEPAGQAHRAVVARVVHEQHLVDDGMWKVGIGPLERRLRLVGGPDPDDPLPPPPGASRQPGSPPPAAARPPPA